MSRELRVIIKLLFSGANQKSSSHFHCLKCDYYCTDTNKVVAHRRQHQKLDSILAAGFEKFTPTQYCATPGCSHNGKQVNISQFWQSVAVFSQVYSKISGLFLVILLLTLSHFRPTTTAENVNMQCWDSLRWKPTNIDIWMSKVAQLQQDYTYSSTTILYLSITNNHLWGSESQRS